jgi:hypothetical protein
MNKIHGSERGFFVLFTLIAASVLLFFLSDLIATISVERGAQSIGGDSEKALHFAEAGLEYYQWHFREFPGDLTDGGAAAPYTHTIADPETHANLGAFSLDITNVNSCGVLSSATVRSSGWNANTPTHRETLSAVYGPPTLAASSTPAKSDTTALPAHLANLKTYAQTAGVYIASSTQYGYKIVFKSDGTFDASAVTGTQAIWGYSAEDDWVQERTIITTTGAAVNHAIPSGCPVIFVEDNVWLEGVVSGKATLAAANLVNAGVDPNIVLTGDITYAHSYDGLTAIAENSVLISLQSPDAMHLSGIFVADKGHFGRNRYDDSGAHAVPGALASYVIRSSLQTKGTLASKGAITTKWISSGSFISGYSNQTDVHDSLLGEMPPPFTPTTSIYFTFTNWREWN